MSKKAKLFELTPELEAKLPEWSEQWSANALSTERLSFDDKQEISRLITGLYKAGGLEPPKRVVFGKSPKISSVAACIASEMLASVDEYGKVPTQASALEAVKRVVSTLQKDEVCYTSDQFGQIRDLVEACTELTLGGKKYDEGLVAKLLGSVGSWSDMYNGGNTWSSSPAFVSFFRYVAKLEVDYTHWDWYEKLAKFPPRFQHAEFVLFCERPTRLFLSDAGQPHHPTGSTHEWSDGTALYHWRGTPIPHAWLRGKPPTAAEALGQINLDLRRAACEIVGWEKILRDLNVRKIDEDKDPTVGTLLEVDLPDAPRSKFLQVLCATGRTFTLKVPEECKTALEANASTWGLNPNEYKPEVQS